MIGDTKGEIMTLYFAVKPGSAPVRLPNLSAHTRLPWMGDGWQFVTAYGEAHYFGPGEHTACSAEESMGVWSSLPPGDRDALYELALQCVEDSLRTEQENGSLGEIHDLDIVGRSAAQALLDDPSPYWRAAACSVLLDGVAQDRSSDQILQAMLNAIASYDRIHNPPWKMR